MELLAFALLYLAFRMAEHAVVPAYRTIQVRHVRTGSWS